MQTLIRDSAVQLPGKVVRKLNQIGNRLLKAARANAARLFYSLPVISRRNPRRMLVKCIDHGTKVESFPSGQSSVATDWYLKIRPAETIHRKPAFSIQRRDLDLFRQFITRHNEGEKFNLPEVFLACINQAGIYSSDFLVISGDKKRIFQESALSREDILEANGILNTIIWPSSKIVPGEYCLLACPWADKNYYEWLLCNLPRLSVIEQFNELESVRLIVPHPQKPFQRDSLLLAGIAPERLIGFDNSYWRVDRLYFPQLPSPLGNPSPQAVAWLRARFLGPQSDLPALPKRLIYVTRRDAPQRRVLNEQEIVTYLQGIGFEIVCLSDLSFAEQISLFREAHLVIGPHGAGFANMVFAPANATLIEFFGDNYLHGCFWALASILGQKHAFLVGPSQWLDYSISLDDLKATLKQVCGI